MVVRALLLISRSEGAHLGGNTTALSVTNDAGKLLRRGSMESIDRISGTIRLEPFRLRDIMGLQSI